MIKLRPYQAEAIAAIEDRFKGWPTQWIELPTGSGKTVTFLSYASKNHKRILVVVPSVQLLNQVYESSLIFYHKSEISRKGNGYNETPKKIHICIINSLRGDYLEFIKSIFDLVIIDEAHHVQSNSYIRLLKTIQQPCKVLGVTATPDRVDRKFISDLLGTRSYVKNILELIDEGYLSDIEGYNVKTKIDISDIDDHNGDFSLQTLYKKLCVESRNNMIVDLCNREMNDRKTLIFCINIEHSKMICDLLNDNELHCMHIDGNMSHKERNSILSSFRNGEISFLTNCQLLTEGFDEPSINGIILARPTKSRALFSQMIGRGLRIFPGKSNCKIIDIVDNHKNIQGFNSLIDEGSYQEIESFRNIGDIEDHLKKEYIKITEVNICRTNLLNERFIEEKEPTYSMIRYLRDNEINFFEPISFSEASFLIWFNELKKEYHGLIR